jgi:adenylate kinase
MNVVLLGPPGSGKGTQADYIQRKLGLIHISTGDLFRKHLGEGTELGSLARTFMDRGELVPDQVTVDMVRERLQEDDVLRGVLLDGFPRTVAQADALADLVAERSEQVDAVVLLDVDEDVLVDRLAGRGRADDNPDTVRARLEVYREQTEPLVDYYSVRGTLRRVDGVGEIDEICDRIIEVLRAIDDPSPSPC